MHSYPNRKPAKKKQKLTAKPPLPKTPGEKRRIPPNATGSITYIDPKTRWPKDFFENKPSTKLKAGDPAMVGIITDSKSRETRGLFGERRKNPHRYPKRSKTHRK